MSETFGWQKYSAPNVVCWFKGYLRIDGKPLRGKEAANRLPHLLPSDVGETCQILNLFDGHFAFIIQRGDRTFAATDPVRTIPLFFSCSGKNVAISSEASELRDQLSNASVNPDALLQIAMAGYALRDKTLYEGLRQLQAGELAVIEKGQIQRVRYKVYQAWKGVRSYDPPRLKADLLAAHIDMFNRLKEGLDDRPVFVPLSGGLDSRLIACGLAHVGYRNVKCFAYGRPGNFEAGKSREVAEALGYDWSFVPYLPTTIRKFFASAVWHDHMAMADSCASVPFIQDLFAIHQMREAKQVPDDAIFINGQTGDFITGNHVPEALANREAHLPPQERRKQIHAAIIAKHFSLWRDLQTEVNLARIGEFIDEVIDDLLPEGFETEEDHGVYEAIEFQERQAKFVVSGQRVYEFFGYDWRLPLWDRAYCDLFEQMPLQAKLGQSLFREVLEEANWGGVWRPLLPKRTITPAYARWLRMAASVPVKLISGQRGWRDFDRRVFSHMIDPLCSVNAVPWSEAILDRRGFRHGVSFRCRQYLANHGIQINSASDLQHISHHR